MNLKYIWSSVMDYINNTLTGQLVDFYHISFWFVTTLAIIICFLIMLVFVVKVVANKDIYTQKDMAVKWWIGIIFFIFTYVIVKSFIVWWENIYFLNLYLVSEDAVSNSEYGKSHYWDWDFIKPDKQVDIKWEKYYYDVRETMINNSDIIYKTKDNISDLDIYKKYKDTTDLQLWLSNYLKAEPYSFSWNVVARYTDTNNKYTTFLLKEWEKYYILPVFLTNKMLSTPTLWANKLYTNTAVSTWTTNNTASDNYIYKSFYSMYPDWEVWNEEFSNLEAYYIANWNSFKENTDYKSKITNNLWMVEKYKDNEKVRMYIFYLVQLLRNKDVIENEKIKQNMYSYFWKTSWDEIKKVIDIEIWQDSTVNIFLPITIIEAIFPWMIQVSTNWIIINNPYNLTSKEEKVISLLKEMETKWDFKWFTFNSWWTSPDINNEQKLKSYISRTLWVNLDEKWNGAITTNSFWEGAKVLCENKEKVWIIFKKYWYNFDDILNCWTTVSIKNLEWFEKIVQSITRTSMIDFKKDKVDFSYFVMYSSLCTDILNCRILLGNWSSLISPYWLYDKVATMDTDAIDNVAINLYDMQNQFISTKDKVYRWNFFVNNSFFKKVYNTNYISYANLWVWSVIDPFLFLLLKLWNYIISTFWLFCIVYFYKKLI